MPSVRQAHLPGNYERFNPATEQTIDAICKRCWEGRSVENTSSLHSVWVSVAGYRMVWWMCPSHEQDLADATDIMVLGSSDGVHLSPKL